jgi:hypothetical protein
MKQLEDHIRETLQVFGTGKDFLDKTQNHRKQKQK